MKIKIIAALVALIPLNSFSQNDIAIQNYYKGEYTAALDGLTTLSESRNNEATFDLGQMYLQGKGVAKNFDKGFQLIQKAASQNYVPAQLFLGKYYLIQNNDFDKAFDWFQKAANLGNLEAQMFCATSYLYGYGVTQNVEKARKFVIKAAQNGDPLAQYELAKLFLNEKHAKDRDLANLWLKKSADNGNAEAQHLLGVLMLTEEEDVPNALKYLSAAANQQNSKAGFVLFSYFLSLQGSAEEFGAAIEWLNKATLAIENSPPLIGSTSNQVQPLFMKPVQANSKNPLNFVEWLRLANDGDINAAQQVGFVYSQNRSAKVMQEVAMEWLSKAAMQDDYIAKIQLRALQAKWNSHAPLKETSILTPKLEPIDKTEIFDPNYQMQNPNSLPNQEIIQALGRLNYDNKNLQVNIPGYQLTVTEKLNDASNHQEIIREADQGYAQAQYQLGLMYQYGISVRKNIQEAIKLYQLSASKNFSKSEYVLGVLALTGNGMKKDFKDAETWLTKAAYEGYVPAQLLLAQFYEVGYGTTGDALTGDSTNHIEKNLSVAKVMYGLAASNDDAQAQYRLAQLYMSGLLDQQNYQQQIKYYHQAFKLLKQASATYPKAKLALAFFYLDQNQLEKNKQWAFIIAQQFANKGNSEANLLLALMYDRGIGTTENKAQALEIFKKLAEAGNPIALFIMGSKYGLGDGVSKSETLSRDYLTKASAAEIGFANYNLAVLDYQQNNTENFLELLKLAKEQGYSPASILLADYYLTHEGSPEEKKQAIAIYENLANGGNVQAQIKLAYMYQHGMYFDTNYQAALELYQKAAEKNNALAQYALGEMYQIGQGTDRDLDQATKWYEKSAKQQFVPAQIALGFIDDVDRQNYPQARMWYELAVQNGNNPIAAYNLALMYEYGKGMPVDLEKAKMLYQQASQGGFQSATTALNNMNQSGSN